MTFAVAETQHEVRPWNFIGFMGPLRRELLRPWLKVIALPVLQST